jgi:hypothetical protein
MYILGPDDVLWVEPAVCYMPAMPNGFALRVVGLLRVDGCDARGVAQVWVRGSWLDGNGKPGGALELLVPLDCQRAVPVNRDGSRSTQSSRAGPELEPRNVGTARVAEGGRHRDSRQRPGQHPERAMIGPPPGYTRRFG